MAGRLAGQPVPPAPVPPRRGALCRGVVGLAGRELGPDLPAVVPGRPEPSPRPTGAPPAGGPGHGVRPSRRPRRVSAGLPAFTAVATGRPRAQGGAAAAELPQLPRRRQAWASHAATRCSQTGSQREFSAFN